MAGSRAAERRTRIVTEPLDFDGTVAAFQGLLQRHVAITVMHPDPDAAVQEVFAACFTGILRRADRPPDWFLEQTATTDDDRIYWFWVLPDTEAQPDVAHGGGWIALDERAFQVASSEGTDTVLVTTHGVCFHIKAQDPERQIGQPGD